MKCWGRRILMNADGLLYMLFSRSSDHAHLFWRKIVLQVLVLTDFDRICLRMSEFLEPRFPFQPSKQLISESCLPSKKVLLCWLFNFTWGNCENPTTQSPATRANYLRSAVLAKATDTMQDGNLTKRERDSFPTTTNKVRWGFCFTCWNSSSALLGLEGKTNMHKSMQKWIDTHRLKSISKNIISKVQKHAGHASQWWVHSKNHSINPESVQTSVVSVNILVRRCHQDV